MVSQCYYCNETGLAHLTKTKAGVNDVRTRFDVQIKSLAYYNYYMCCMYIVFDPQNRATRPLLEQSMWIRWHLSLRAVRHDVWLSILQNGIAVWWRYESMQHWKPLFYCYFYWWFTWGQNHMHLLTCRYIISFMLLLRFSPSAQTLTSVWRHRVSMAVPVTTWKPDSSVTAWPATRDCCVKQVILRKISALFLWFSLQKKKTRKDESLFLKSRIHFEIYMFLLCKTFDANTDEIWVLHYAVHRNSLWCNFLNSNQRMCVITVSEWRHMQ